MANRKQRLIFVTILIALCVPSTHAEEPARESVSQPAFGLYLVVDAPTKRPDAIEMARIGDPQGKLYLEPEPKLTIEDVAYVVAVPIKWESKEVEVFKQQGLTLPSHEIRIVFTPAGKEKLVRVTSENLGKRLAIVVYGELVMAPKILMAITEGESLVQGNFITGEAQAIAARLNEAKKLSGDNSR